MVRIILVGSLVLGLAVAARLLAPPMGAPSFDQRARQLIRQLDDPRFEARQQAEEELRGMGTPVVAIVQQELTRNPPLEVARRLEGILHHLGKLAWHKEQDAAFVAARRSGKPVLVFSTIGEVNGFACLGSNLMRSVTFADLELVDYIKNNFVTVWHNQAPEIFSEEGQQQPCTPEQAKAYPEGGGGSNVRTYFCLPDGQVVYYLEGYWRKDRYLAEARFIRELSDRAMKLPADQRTALFRQALTERQKAIAEERQALEQRHPQEFQKPVHESEIHKRHAALGLLANSLTTTLNLSARKIEETLAQMGGRRCKIV